nr:response regulator [uncultured Holophaga sp.]
MTDPRRLGLFPRIFLMFLLVPILAILLGVGMVLPRQERLLMQALDSQMSGTLASITGINSSTFARDDFAGLVEIGTQVLEANPELRYVIISRNGGTAIQNTDGHWAELDLRAPENQWIKGASSRIIEHNPLTGTRVYHHAFPVKFYNTEWGWIYVGVSMATYDAQLHQLYINFVVGALVFAALSALLAWLFTRRLATPLLHLKTAAERIQGGELGMRAVVSTGDEVEQLSLAFNGMAEALQRLKEGLEARVNERTLELQRSEERYRLLFENAAEAIFVLQQRRIRFWNPALRGMVGREQDQLTGTRFEELVLQEDRPAFLDLVARAESTGSPVLREGLRLESRGGEPVWVNLNCVVIRWDEDPALLFFAQDTSESRALQVQLFHAQKMEAIGTLAGGIAHDFNNILAGILGYVSLLQMGKEPGSPEYERLQKVEKQVNSATGLTRQLLGFARGGAYEPKPWDLNQIVQGALDLFGRTKRQVRITLELHRERCVVDCDRGQIEQVLINLFVNAAHAMPDGGTLTIRTDFQDHGRDFAEAHGVEPGTYVEVSVKDTGVGMDSATLARIFDPFFTTRSMGGGTGLGLASVYGILKNHGGCIRVESRPGMGANFTFSLPRSQVGLISEERQRVKQITAGEGSVLIVDDQEIIRTVGQSMLEMIGYRVTAVESGLAAIEFIKGHPGMLDLVILDMIMPGMSGGETFQRMRALEPELPVILSSGYSLDGEVEALLECGCNGFLQKPFNAAQLAEKISEVRGAPPG